MKLTVFLTIKFRAFGITFGNIDKKFTEPIPLPVPLPLRFDKILYNDKGVFLKVVVE